MNKTAAFIVFGVLTLAGIAGTIFIMVHRPDATATFTAFVAQMLGLVVVAGGLGAGLNSIQQKVETVQKQTNGTNTRLQEEVARLNSEVATLNRQLQPDPEHGQTDAR